MTLIFIPFFGTTNNTRWWFQRFFMFTPILGEMIQFDLRIFFKWVGSNHQLEKMVLDFLKHYISIFVFMAALFLGRIYVISSNLPLGRIHQVGCLLSSLKQQTQQTSSRLGSPLSNELNYKKLAAKKRSERAS